VSRPEGVVAPWCVRAGAARRVLAPWMAPATANDADDPALRDDGATPYDPPPEASPAVPAAEHDALRAEHDALRAEHAGLAAAYTALHAEHRALAAAHAALADDMATHRQRVVAASEPELVRLACAVARRVVGRELRADPAVDAAWAREAVAALDGHEHIEVAVAADVAAHVPAEAWSRAPGPPAHPVVDPALAPGEVAVRAGAASVAAGAGARFDAVDAAVCAGLP